MPGPVLSARDGQRARSGPMRAEGDCPREDLLRRKQATKEPAVWKETSPPPRHLAPSSALGARGRAVPWSRPCLYVCTSARLWREPLTGSSSGCDARAWSRLWAATAPTAKTPIWSEHSDGYTTGRAAGPPHPGSPPAESLVSRSLMVISEVQLTVLLRTTGAGLDTAPTLAGERQWGRPVVPAQRGARAAPAASCVDSTSHERLSISASMNGLNPHNAPCSGCIAIYRVRLAGEGAGAARPGRHRV
ncbi:uncharacterized protein LOC123833111 [Phyllostomus hastatus]|uniref:uncharacterized protein LOC123833111 n=1 Tax=Phyllostomus hastatus TaxID=9423 RepID=UPI001E67E7A8|nr:uncharacterized protein LOC123833111 [Phyllostomus hastatus]